MPDENNTDSSTVDQINTASDAALSDRDFARYAEIENAREAGKEPPPAPSKPDASATSTTTEKNAESEPAPGKPIQEKKPKGAEERKIELGADIAALLKQRAELKAEVDGIAADKTTDKSGEKKADPPPAPVVTKPATVTNEEPVEPKLEDFATFAEYQVADRKYVRDLAKFEAKQLVEGREAEQAQAAADATHAEAWNKKMAAAKEEFSDFEVVAFSPTTPISNVIFGFLKQSGDNEARLLYKLGQNDGAEAKRISALAPDAKPGERPQGSPYAAVRALIELEATLSTPEKKTVPVKKHTAAPPPATDLGGRDSEPADAEVAALNRGDFATYTALANAREMKAAKG